jgi:hypothetical protein
MKKLPTLPGKKESSIEGRVCALADSINLPHTKLNTIGQRNNPDRIFWLNGGNPLMIEFKRTGEKPNEAQKNRIKQLRQLGYRVEVCDNFLKAKAVLMKYAANRGHQKLTKGKDLNSASSALWQDFY